MQESHSEHHPKLTIKTIARELGFGEDILILDLVGGCGVASGLTGNLWRVFEPASGRAFVICLAEGIRKHDIESLGLNEETQFVCYETAIEADARDFVLERTSLLHINHNKQQSSTRINGTQL